MKIGITDNQGRLGKILGEWYPRMDMMDAHKFDVIIHNGAFTDVDGCETDVMKALMNNVFFSHRLRMATTAKIIFLSTDYIFDGVSGPYSERAQPNPLSVYGWTKWIGERMLNPTDTIIRTTGLYGGHKPDFVTWTLEKFKNKVQFSVSSRMITSPTNVYHLAEALKHIVKKNIQDHVINIAGDTIVSRYAFATYIAKTFGFSSSLVGYASNTNFGLAKRPERAGLKTDLANSLGIPIYSVFDGLKRAKENYES
jgi:dTDP-4-dehydrorhamnose reductase